MTADDRQARTTAADVRFADVMGRFGLPYPRPPRGGAASVPSTSAQTTDLPGFDTERLLDDDLRAFIAADDDRGEGPSETGTPQ